MSTANTAGSNSPTEQTIDMLGLAIITVRRNSRGELGLFATQPLNSDVIIVQQWHTGFYDTIPGWERVTLEQMNQLPEPQRSLFYRYGLDEDFDRIVGPSAAHHVTTYDNFINHSCESNLGYNQSGDVITLRPITPYEELTLDYGYFCVNRDEPFDCTCGSAQCRGRIYKDDWQQLIKTHGRNVPPFLWDKL